MTKSEIIEHLASRHAVSKVAAKDILEDLVNIINEGVRKQGRIEHSDVRVVDAQETQLPSKRIDVRTILEREVPASGAAAKVLGTTVFVAKRAFECMGSDQCGF